MLNDDRIQVFIAHGNPLVAAGLEAAFGTQEDFHIVGRRETDDVSSVDAATVAVTDYEGGTRRLAAQRGARCGHGCRVLILTDDDSEVSSRRAVELGVSGYLPLSSGVKSVVHAVRCIHNGGTAIAPEVPNSAVDATMTANQIFTSGFPEGQLSCASPESSPANCLPPVAITAVPDGQLHTPYFMEWSLGIEHQFGTTASVQAQYVGTRAVNQPYSTQVNGYQTVCQGCFAPFLYLQSTDPRFGAVTQFSTGANSHYNGLQLTAMKRLGHGLQGQVNYTWSRCMDTVSNGGFLSFSAGGILSPLPGDLARDYGPCDYDIRHNLNAQYVYQLPVKVHSHSLGYALNGWQISGTAFWHSGVPFSVLSTPYSANGNGIVQGSGPQFASLVPIQRMRTSAAPFDKLGSYAALTARR